MNELEKNRQVIDEIDSEISKLFEQRMQAVGEIAEYKKRHGLPVFDKSREDALIKNNSQRISNSTLCEYYVKFIKDLIETSKKYQYRIINGAKIAYCGEEGAFAHLAGLKAYPSAEFIAYGDFGSVYKAVENGDCDIAVLPIENSYAGDVGAVMDLMFSGSLFVNSVIEMEISHNLLIKEDASIDDVKYVVSHPQALEQCEDFITARGFEKISYSNTALASKYVAEQCDKTYGAIGSIETAKKYGLKVAQSGINSSKINTTRFALLSRCKHTPLEEERNGNEHFIMVFTTQNEAGALANALNIIGAHNFNMRTLRSRPMKELLWNYYFYVEAEGNISTENGREMLQELSAVCARVKLIGTYN